MYHCKYDILSLYTKMNNTEKITDNYRDKSKSKHVFFSIFSAIIVWLLNYYVYFCWIKLEAMLVKLIFGSAAIFVACAMIYVAFEIIKGIIEGIIEAFRRSNKKD